MKGKVVVGLSGGVDSSVAAYILKEEGYEVIGASVVLYKESKNPYACCSIGSLQMARRVAVYLGIEFYELDYSDGFKRDVIGYFINEYARYRTPNPCLICNRDYKIKALFDLAYKIGADYVATGHYIRKTSYNGVELMMRGKDRNKDQSYFMFRIPSQWIKRLLFPVGNMTKSEVRNIALNAKLPTAKKPESQDLCFVDGDYRDFLLRMGLKPTEGRFLYKGRTVGIHKGAFFYTIGQRKGLNVSLGKRVYVKGFKNGDILLGDLDEVMMEEILVSDINWHYKPEGKIEVYVQVRAGSNAEKARIIQVENGVLVKFYKPVFAPTPGQGAAFYIDDILIGGGTIESSPYDHEV